MTQERFVQIMQGGKLETISEVEIVKIGVVHRTAKYKVAQKVLYNDKLWIITGIIPPDTFDHRLLQKYREFGYELKGTGKESTSPTISESDLKPVAGPAKPYMGKGTTQKQNV